jgi:hypothetical protein
MDSNVLIWDTISCKRTTGTSKLLKQIIFNKIVETYSESELKLQLKGHINFKDTNKGVNITFSK